MVKDRNRRAGRGSRVPPPAPEPEGWEPPPRFGGGQLGPHEPPNFALETDLLPGIEEHMMIAQSPYDGYRDAAPSMDMARYTHHMTYEQGTCGYSDMSSTHRVDDALAAHSDMGIGSSNFWEAQQSGTASDARPFVWDGRPIMIRHEHDKHSAAPIGLLEDAPAAPSGGAELMMDSSSAARATPAHGAMYSMGPVQRHSKAQSQRKESQTGKSKRHHAKKSHHHSESSSVTSRRAESRSLSHSAARTLDYSVSSANVATRSHAQESSISADSVSSATEMIEPGVASSGPHELPIQPQAEEQESPSHPISLHGSLGMIPERDDDASSFVTADDASRRDRQHECIDTTTASDHSERSASIGTIGEAAAGPADTASVSASSDATQPESILAELERATASRAISSSEDGHSGQDQHEENENQYCAQIAPWMPGTVVVASYGPVQYSQYGDTEDFVYSSWDGTQISEADMMSIQEDYGGQERQRQTSGSTSSRTSGSGRSSHVSRTSSSTPHVHVSATVEGLFRARHMPDNGSQYVRPRARGWL